MKTLIKIMVMTMFVLSMYSCNDEVPTISADKGFIIKRIEMKSNGYSKYYSEWTGTGYVTIELPTGWFNVGDTIKLVPTKYCTK